ncbi:hypothetical protein GYMLUDRAFT_892031 [Collybiopsis luxurians FD-317 M1]|uniref:Uncharacterized protein n=1 Tax=Collybiopsis luxurians FD-317 M1 TaxID=944289 RepID=A0A0D0BYC0_9AGAR|nr:hypothetical protein GYMLUDRAFT_892031 [Collybiopsis luxurians FD-317 M1]
MANLAESSLPNLNVHLNHLTPELVAAWEITRNIYLVTLEAFMLSSVPQDLVIPRRRRAAVLAYGLCRPAALAAVIISTVAKTAQLSCCPAMKLGDTCCTLLGYNASSFLFLLRAQVIYSTSTLVKCAFQALWVVQVSLSIPIPLGPSSSRLEGTHYCVNIGVKEYVVIIPIIYDFLVFVFISYRVATTHGRDVDDCPLWKMFLSGRALPRLSKALLQGGQQYFLITVGMSIALLFLPASQSIPDIYHATLGNTIRTCEFHALSSV